MMMKARHRQLLRRYYYRGAAALLAVSLCAVLFAVVLEETNAFGVVGDNRRSAFGSVSHRRESAGSLPSESPRPVSSALPSSIAAAVEFDPTGGRGGGGWPGGPWNSTESSSYAGLVPARRRRFSIASPRRPEAAVVRDRVARYKVYCDLDGVLVDFEHGIRKLFPDFLGPDRSTTLQDLEKSAMWQRVAAADAFFERLPWTEHGPRLWDAIRHLQPDILTGVPCHEPSRTEKFNWCRRELGCQVAHVDMAGYRNDHSCVNGGRYENNKRRRSKRGDDVINVITCWSLNKHHESGPGAVLIDDLESLRADWEAKGGIFVHHTDVDSTLEKLRNLGLI